MHIAHGRRSAAQRWPSPPTKADPETACLSTGIQFWHAYCQRDFNTSESQSSLLHIRRVVLPYTPGNCTWEGSQMTVVQKRLSVVTNARASLDKKMRQLERLRDQVEKAELMVADHDQLPVPLVFQADGAAVRP